MATGGECFVISALHLHRCHADSHKGANGVPHHFAAQLRAGQS